MKIAQIKTQIIQRYANLTNLRNSSNNPVIRVIMDNWSAGRSSGIDKIWYRNLINVQVFENDVSVNKKPFFLTDKWALRKANKALNRILENYNVYDIVEKVRRQPK